MHCRHSWHTGVIISSLLLPQLMPCLLSHLPFPLTHQVGGTSRRDVFSVFPAILSTCTLLALSFSPFHSYCVKSFLPVILFLPPFLIVSVQSATSSYTRHNEDINPDMISFSVWPADSQTGGQGFGWHMQRSRHLHALHQN